MNCKEVFDHFKNKLRRASWITKKKLEQSGQIINRLKTGKRETQTGKQEHRTTIHRENNIYGIPEFRKTGVQELRKTEIQEIRKMRKLEFWKTGKQEFRKPGNQSVTNSENVSWNKNVFLFLYYHMSQTRKHTIHEIHNLNAFYGLRLHVW